MNEKEMIEDMVKVITQSSCKGGECENCVFTQIAEAVAGEITLTCSCVKALYNEGYRKIPEGSVVWSKEEYGILINQNKGLKEENHTLRLENNDFEAQVNELEEQRDRQAYIAEELIQEKHRWTEQARKETAKEIIEEIKSLLFPEEGSLLAWLVAIADKYGVEVEE